MQAVHAIVHTCLEVSAKHRRGGRGSVEDTSTLCKLRRLVPRPQDHMRSRIEDRFEQTNEEANGDNMLRCGHGRKAEREHRPQQLAGGYPNAGANLRQNNLAGNLSDDVTARPSDVYHVQFVVVHLQVFFHAGDVCVGDVRLVQVLDEVSQAEDGEDAEIEALYEGCLFFGATGLVVPNVGVPRHLGLRLGHCAIG